MNPRHRFARLCLWLACALPLPALAAAGLVQFVAGEVQMRRSDLLSAVARGALLESGDTVLTGATGRAQIRFTDGGLVALYPDSQFTVTRYVDAGDAAQDSFAVGLLRGGMRAITGLIGKRNPANYQLTTPTAVVGIRGSAFRAFFNAQGLLEVGGEADEIEVCTQAGCVRFLRKRCWRRIRNELSNWQSKACCPRINWARRWGRNSKFTLTPNTHTRRSARNPARSSPVQINNNKEAEIEKGKI